MRAPLSRSSHELLVNCPLIARELLVNSTLTVRELFVAVRDNRGMARIVTHPPASSRRVHEQFAHSSRPGR